MIPTKNYHKVTAYHREPGGLRRLDFFVNSIKETFDDKSKFSVVKILDVGCGKGNVTLPLAFLGYQVTGVDYDAESIREARKSAEELGLSAVFHEGSLDRVSAQRFDVIIASEVLEHQINPEVFLKDLAQLLTPNGILLLSVPNGNSLEERIRKFTTHTRFGRWFKRNVKRWIAHQDIQSAAEHPHEQYFSWKSLRRVLRDGGFKIDNMASAAAVFKEFYYLLGRIFLKRGSRWFHFLDSLDARLSPLLPISMMDGWLIKAHAFDASKPLVMQIVPTMNSGGAEKLIYELAKRLPEQGYDVITISMFGGGPLETDFIRDGLPLKVFRRSGFFAIKTFFELKEFMAYEEPVLVHTHLFGADVFGRVAARVLKVPVIISTEHSINCDHGGFKRFVKKVLSKFTTVFISVSKEAKKYMTRVEGIQEGKIRVIENGIDLSKIKTRPPTPFHDKPRLITVGRLVRQKDQATLFKALSLVKRPWMLQIVGGGALEEQLRALAERLGIGAKIYWLGYRSDVPDLLANSDLFCFPSRWEGLGLAFMEAAAAGVPIIASDLPVFREILNSKQAVFVPAADVPAWSKAIDGILSDPMIAVRRAQEAIPIIARRFSIERMVKAYADLYRELINKKV
ncbi:MAG: glycosyltransferase [Patescibacteria group bacterium]